jgi:hypothetical protein
MSEPYNTGVFKKHAATCSGPTKAAQKTMAPTGSQTLFAMATAKNWSKSSKTLDAPSVMDVPCPGLNSHNIPHQLKDGLTTYLLRSPVAGGGGPTLDALTKILFPAKIFMSLTSREKQEVRSAQRQKYRWHNHADLHRVIAADCIKTVQVRDGTSPTPACANCRALAWDKNFKRALSIPLPSDENFKHTPNVLIDKAAVDRFGRISGLKAIIDANDKVGQPKTCCIVSWPELTSYRIHVYLAFVMLQKSSMESIKMGLRIYLFRWLTLWLQNMTRLSVVLGFKDFATLLGSQSLHTSSTFTAHEPTKQSEMSCHCPLHAVSSRSFCPH